ncbi:MAG: hypothetical protein R3D43_00735 [Tepidamorphaceae bacterium]|nr:hypothetical protein [Rhodobiaceae bacterium]MCC0047753.1 hypothetical protein [Rhodobiaceae bacterium]
MNGVARVFFLSSLVFGLAGLLLGNIMAASHDHTQLPTHAHTMVVGWLSFAVFGMFYHQFPAAAASMLAKIHMAVAELSLLVLIVALYMLYGGKMSFEPAAAISSIVYALSFLLFAFIAWRAVSAKR